MSSMRRRSPPHYESRDNRDGPRSNMRMDRKPNATRISDPSHPAGKRKEIDNVMKKARQAPPNEYWDKKLLEAEEKDPGRWKHTGYKKMYVNGVRKSRSRSPMRKTPVSPHRSARNFPQSPVRRRMSRTPERYKPRSPPPSRYPREMVKPKEVYRPVGKGRPISPPPKQVARTPSISSCSDDSCSVCSSDDGRRVDKRMPERNYHGPMNRMRPVSPEPVPVKKNKLKAVSPKRRHLKRPVSPRRVEPSTPTLAKKKDKVEKVRTRVKVEGEKRRRTPSTASEDSTSSGGSFPALTATTRISLSERFGKMAQWNNDRKYDMSNMKITKNMNSEGGDRSAVMIQEQASALSRESPPMRSFTQYSGEGHFPEELLAQSSAQALGLNAWDDVRVRFDYYKSKGYLRDLTLQDYQQWENWWRKYQEWLKQERYFEMIERNMMRRRRKKIPIQQRLN